MKTNFLLLHWKNSNYICLQPHHSVLKHLFSVAAYKRYEGG